MSKRTEQLLEQLLAGGRNSLSLVSTSVVDANANTAIGVTAASSAVNYLSTTNSAANASPILGVAGSDTNISLKLRDKGTGAILSEAPFLELRTVSTITTASAVTFTAGQVLGKLILRDPNGSARADLMPTAGNLVAAIPGAVAGLSFTFAIRNTADASEVVTLTTNTGASLSGTMTIGQNSTRMFVVVLDNVGSGTESYSVYSLGTLTH